MRLKRRKSCRVCGKETLVDVLSLGNLAISGFFEEDSQGVKVPLTLSLCDPSIGGCSLVQLRHTSVPPDLLYRQYWYKSGMNSSMREALLDVYEKAMAYVNVRPEDIVLDIGANDGTLLRYFETATRVGFEPAKNLLIEAKSGSNSIINDFFNKQAFIDRFGQERKARIVTSIAMFYDLEDPNTFVADIREILAPDGIWINQLSYLPSMLSQNAFDNICSEHLEYYSLTSLKFLLDKHQLEIIDVELNNVNGGSFRVYSRHKNSQSPIQSKEAKLRVEKLLLNEVDKKLDSIEIYKSFSKRIKEYKTTTRRVVKNIVKSGGSVYVYGASTKGNTLLQYFHLDHSLIKGAAERNPDKWGKKTVATNIPIMSEGEMREKHPTHLLVLPWHFKDEFIKREQKYLDEGGKMIFPLPKFEIISKDNLI